MPSIIQIAFDGVALSLLVPVSVLSLEVALGAASTVNEPSARGERRRLAILIPAHDESSMIADTLRSIKPQLTHTDRLLVVADNCTDDTAGVAVAEGAEAIERRDSARRGKGFALDFGIRHLEQDAPDVVIVVDADCRVAPGSIDRLARVCDSSARPVQALYLMSSPPGASVKVRIAEFSWIVKNLVRPGGLHRLGLPCHLMGSGMAFPWSCIQAARLATGHIVEDLKLGIDLACAGSAPLFCPEALVTSEFPQSNVGIASQRTRWEHGHLSVILSDAPRLLRQSLIRREPALLALALDVSVPPLALLALLVAVAWIAAFALFLIGRVRFPFVVTSISAGLLTASVLYAWSTHGRGIISLRDLPSAFLYALRKIPIYARFLLTRQVTWIRSKRRQED